jgi:hypothetical protein
VARQVSDRQTTPDVTGRPIVRLLQLVPLVEAGERLAFLLQRPGLNLVVPQASTLPVGQRFEVELRQRPDRLRQGDLVGTQLRLIEFVIVADGREDRIQIRRFGGRSADTRICTPGVRMAFRPLKQPNR